MTRFKSKNTGLWLLTLLGWPLLFSPIPGTAGDLIQNDKTLAEQLANTLEPSQVLWLNDDQNRFLTIFTPDQSGQPKGAVVILHDADSHPDWPEVIRPLRSSLPLHGWATIAVQLPQLDAIAGYIGQQNTVNTRISKAIEHLQSLGLRNIVLAGHGSGALAAAAYLAAGSIDPDIRGFVAISPSVHKTGKEDDYLPAQLEKIRLPIFDIYGSRDLPAVTDTAMTRSLAAKRATNGTTDDQQLDAYKKAGLSKTANDAIKGYIAYRQIVVEGADHYFQGQGEILSRRVLGWLERHTNGTAVTSKR